jgi:hypothetical protein
MIVVIVHEHRTGASNAFAQLELSGRRTFGTACGGELRCRLRFEVTELLKRYLSALDKRMTDCKFLTTLLLYCSRFLPLQWRQLQVRDLSEVGLGVRRGF